MARMQQYRTIGNRRKQLMLPWNSSSKNTIHQSVLTKKQITQFALVIIRSWIKVVSIKFKFLSLLFIYTKSFDWEDEIVTLVPRQVSDSFTHRFFLLKIHTTKHLQFTSLNSTPSSKTTENFEYSINRLSSASIFYFSLFASFTSIVVVYALWLEGKIQKLSGWKKEVDEENERFSI